MGINKKMNGWIGISSEIEISETERLWTIWFHQTVGVIKLEIQVLIEFEWTWEQYDLNPFMNHIICSSRFLSWWGQLSLSWFGCIWGTRTFGFIFLSTLPSSFLRSDFLCMNCFRIFGPRFRAGFREETITEISLYAVTVSRQSKSIYTNRLINSFSNGSYEQTFRVSEIVSDYLTETIENHHKDQPTTIPIREDITIIPASWVHDDSDLKNWEKWGPNGNN
jgi:hypothetical protein